MTAPGAYTIALEQYDGAVKHLRLKRGIQEYLRIPRRELAVATARQHGTTRRTAALVRALQRVSEAVMALGIFP